MRYPLWGVEIMSVVLNDVGNDKHSAYLENRRSGILYEETFKSWNNRFDCVKNGMPCKSNSKLLPETFKKTKK